MSTTSRILLGFLLLLAAGLWLLERELTGRVERQYMEAAEESMVDVAQVMASLVEAQLDDQGRPELESLRSAWEAARNRPFRAQIYNMVKTTLDLNVYVTDASGLVLFDSDHGRCEGQDLHFKRDVALTLAGAYGARSTFQDPQDEDSSVMHVAAPVRHHGAIVGVVSVYKAQRSLFTFRDETRIWMRTTGLIFFGAITVGAYLVVTLFSRPIRRLTEYARAVARGERAAPPKGGSPEALTLTRAFEEMRDALENRAYVENYVQTVTHEMKSPVAAIRGAAELLREDMPAEQRDRFLANIQAEAGRLQNIIERLLALSALESRKALDHPEPVALAELAAAVCSQLEAVAQGRGVRLELLLEARPVVRGEPYLLETALSNLVQNAIDFSPAGARVQVRLAASATHAELVVEDQGPGIPDYALGRLFERFYSLKRPGTNRKSSGLGLCFVREAAALHRGSITLENQPKGPGARATLRLPLINA